MKLDEVKDSYIEGSRNIVQANEELATDSYGLKEIFTKVKLDAHKAKLVEFYSWLREYDEAFAGFLTTGGSINGVQMRQANLAIVSEARSLFVSSLNSFERELTDVEKSVNFRLSTTIAIVAIVVSVIGVL